MLQYVLRDDVITVIINGKSHMVQRATHPLYHNLVAAINNNDEDYIINNIDIKSAISTVTNGSVTISSTGKVLFNGSEVSNKFADRIMSVAANQGAIKPLMEFFDRLMANTSMNTINQISRFIDEHNLPITHDGYLIGYKAVSNEYMDLHTNTISNKVGSVVTMPRNQVCDDPNQDCAAGLHFSNFSYALGFGGRNTKLMVVKIDPADIVCIPSSSTAKARCCKYVVVDEQTSHNEVESECGVYAEPEIKEAPTKTRLVDVPTYDGQTYVDSSIAQMHVTYPAKWSKKKVAKRLATLKVGKSEKWLIRRRDLSSIKLTKSKCGSIINVIKL